MPGTAWFIFTAPSFTVDRGLAPLIVSKTNQEAINLQTYRPDAPQELCDLVANLLKRDPLQHPSEAREVASRLEAMLPNIDATARVKRLRSLAKRTAQSSNASATNSANSVPWSPTLATNVSQTSSDGGRRNKWLAGFLAGGAAALLAGLLLYVKTDRGTLVIESDLEDVQVSFSQEGKPAENFEVHSGENRTVLKTGSYQVQVDASGESVQFSPQQVVIQRGEETILKVRRIDGVAPNRDSLAGKDRSTPSKDQTETFRGQPLSYWIETLKTERDVDSLGEAMDAVTVLANTKDVELAKAMLIAARDYGGWSSSSPDNAKKISGRSMYFMHYFNLYFQRMMPEPGLIAIADELKQDNPRSRAACLWACISMDEEKWQAWANASASSQTAIQLQEQVQRLLTQSNDNESVLGLQYEGYNRNALLSIGYRLALSWNPAIPQIPALKTELQRRISEVAPPKEFAERMTEFFKVATSNKPDGIGGNSGDRMERVGMGGGVYTLNNRGPVLTIEDVLLARRYNLEIPLPLQVQTLATANVLQWDAAQAELTSLFTESPEDVSNEIWLALGLSSSSDYSNGGMGGIPHASLLLQESIPTATSESETNLQSSLLVEAARQTTHPDLVGAALAAAASTWWTRTYTKGEAEMEKVVGELAEAWKIAKKLSTKPGKSDDSEPSDSFSFTWENNNPFESLPPKPIVTGGMF
ncbi:hypothetical protein FF011L_21620 [Roseimaritima multifibrata]|uniref:Uncharacterized protein n=1 Tax=Roseimaritima multifibrata TaxID=1930274 RepID=A0A517MES2_9BACT|nr:hypothetical protein [Roseimaritima multifibrata]QDS93392.1 hypothetical protein FF011L_21620 [Roseimaritima multifibrata]